MGKDSDKARSEGLLGAVRPYQGDISPEITVRHLRWLLMFDAKHTACEDWKAVMHAMLQGGRRLAQNMLRVVIDKFGRYGRWPCVSALIKVGPSMMWPCLRAVETLATATGECACANPYFVSHLRSDCHTRMLRRSEVTQTSHTGDFILRAPCASPCPHSSFSIGRVGH